MPIRKVAAVCDCSKSTVQIIKAEMDKSLESA
ncbi:hypothetical protein ABH904_002950 [Pseudomonas frederiksbergensis]